MAGTGKKVKPVKCLGANVQLFVFDQAVSKPSRNRHRGVTDSWKKRLTKLEVSHES